MAGFWIASAMGIVAVMNSYQRPGTDEAMGLAFPVLILIIVTAIMTLIAKQHKFGRHVFAVGGDPVSARLTGIDTNWVVVRVFVLMGFLSGLASIVLTARLNAAASGAGTMMELYVIAAAVIGGTSLAGGVGTIFGGVVGALIMQSLQSAMVLMGVACPIQSMVLAGVLVFAVWIDTLWRARRPS
jgi:D-xylose transport system permease protein